MLIDKKIIIKVNSWNLKSYLKYGYECKVGDILEIDSKDISNGSNVKVNVKCSICDTIKNICYCDYIRNITNNNNIYFCSVRCRNMITNHTRLCKKCNNEKDINEFYKYKRGTCKECEKSRTLENYRNNKEAYKTNSKKWYSNNKEKSKENSKLYRINNKDEIKKRTKIYRINNNYYKSKIGDNLFKVTINIRNLIRQSIKRQKYKKYSKTYEILGCSYQEFKVYMESKFQKGMTWENYGNYWHMDHIIPISWAKDEEEIIKLNHYMNFQPLYAIDNLIKGNRFSG